MTVLNFCLLVCTESRSRPLQHILANLFWLTYYKVLTFIKLMVFWLHHNYDCVTFKCQSWLLIKSSMTMRIIHQLNWYVNLKAMIFGVNWWLNEKELRSKQAFVAKSLRFSFAEEGNKITANYDRREVRLLVQVKVNANFLSLSHSGSTLDDRTHCRVDVHTSIFETNCSLVKKLSKYEKKISNHGISWACDPKLHAIQFWFSSRSCRTRF